MNRKTLVLISAKLTLESELQDFLLMTIQVQFSGFFGYSVVF